MNDFFEAHPAADAFPMMDNERYSELLLDIKANGQRIPIILHDGKILDGRNRYKACAELGIKPKTENHNGDPWNLVWSLNAQRRDLNDEQRALIWIRCNKNSEAWLAELRRIADEANRKR